jgi:gas vesicle protein
MDYYVCIDQQRAQDKIRTSDDPCAATFEALATNLMASVAEQSKEMEDSLAEWENRMQRQESRHNENLFKMIVTAINTSDSTIRITSNSTY